MFWYIGKLHSPPMPRFAEGEGVSANIFTRSPPPIWDEQIPGLWSHIVELTDSVIDIQGT